MRERRVGTPRDEARSVATPPFFLLRRLTAMIGTKMSDFATLSDLFLEELVPKDNFYRRLEETLDLSFVRELVRDCYACLGRPSVDPVVFFRLQHPIEVWMVPSR